MEEPESGNPPVVCPRCGTPVRPNTQFCDHCGARVTSPPACSLCGTLLEPNSRFCPSCGTMIGTSVDRSGGAEPSLNERPGGLGNGADAGSRIRQMRSRWRNHAAITIPPGIRSLLHPSTLFARYGGVLLIIAALILVVAGVYALMGAVFFGQGEPVVTVTPSQTLATVVVTPAAVSVTPEETVSEVSLVPGPVEVPPDNLKITLQVERDPRSFIVTVMYMGGKGQYGVRDIHVRVTRSDGQVLEKTFRPVQVGSGIELQGTQKTDRVEVTARYHNGEEYKIVDQVFEYRIRN